MAENALQRLNAAGQSIWLDFIDRTMLRNGDLQRRITDESLTGMTSNPTIFEKALAEGDASDEQLHSADADFTALELFGSSHDRRPIGVRCVCRRTSRRTARMVCVIEVTRRGERCARRSPRVRDSGRRWIAAM